MELTAEKIVENWNEFLEIIQNYIPGKRGKKLLDFYQKNEDRFSLMPASGKTSFHNAFPGGYIDHVIRVFQCSLWVCELWRTRGACIDFSEEELAFVSINHDLGKFGSFDHEAFIEQDSDWHAKRGEVYKHNPLLSFMKVQDRSLFLLQSLEIPVSEKEYLGIKLHDGLYEEGNKSYYIAFSEDYKLKTNLPYIVHQADLMATRIESDKAAGKSSVETEIVDIQKEVEIIEKGEKEARKSPEKKITTKTSTDKKESKLGNNKSVLSKFFQ